MKRVIFVVACLHILCTNAQVRRAIVAGGRIPATVEDIQTGLGLSEVDFSLFIGS